MVDSDRQQKLADIVKGLHGRLRKQLTEGKYTTVLLIYVVNCGKISYVGPSDYVPLKILDLPAIELSLYAMSLFS